ncbi:MAG TPA: DJ-1 family protein [Verrucomicrobia bacterium]|nr:DJ-1 family protein [Verrucomicrobiota bacterium]
MTQKKNVCVLVADGSEEMEVVITVDVLRRAGIGVFLAGVGEETRMVTTSRGVRIAPDGAWDPAEMVRFDALVIPGGIGGTQAMREDESVKQAIREFLQAGKVVASLCAGPTVLHEAGVLAGKTYTSHPGSRDELPAGIWVDKAVVRDGNLLTSQAPGTAFAFALALIEMLESPEIAQKVAAGMLYQA